MQKHKVEKCIMGLWNCELHDTVGTKQNGKARGSGKGDCSQSKGGGDLRAQEFIML